MQTYRATYRLRPTGASAQDTISGPAPAVTETIRDDGLAHAAARASWRLPMVAATQGWHPAATELVAVELVHEQESAVGRAPRALQLAHELCGCEDEARCLVAAAAVVAGVQL